MRKTGIIFEQEIADSVKAMLYDSIMREGIRQALNGTK